MFLSTLICGWIFPWWWPALAAYAVGFWMAKRSDSPFFVGFTGTAVAWIAWAVYLDWRNHHLLSGRIAVLFHLPSAYAVLVLTGLIGGLTGGLAAWAGFSLGNYLKPKFARTV